MHEQQVKPDRRKAYSRQAIQKALKLLLDTTPIHKITVTEICRVADVNRTTFYANYTDLQDLLYSISQELDEKINAVLSQYDSLDGISYYTALVNTIRANADACLTIMRIPDREFQHVNIDFTYKKVMQVWQSNAFGHTSALHTLAPEYILAGDRAIINSWLEGGMLLPAETIASCLYTFNDLMIKQLHLLE